MPDDGDAKRVVDSRRTWHWTGTGLVGQGANCVLFGHRTEAGWFALVGWDDLG